MSRSYSRQSRFRSYSPLGHDFAPRGVNGFGKPSSVTFALRMIPVFAGMFTFSEVGLVIVTDGARRYWKS
jgi:hypothetical protein